MDVKKRGKNFIINSIFIMVVVVALLLILKSESTITGMQVLDSTTTKMKLETALESASFAQLVNQANICVVINDPQEQVSLKAVKTGTGWTVTQEDSFFCEGLQSQDFVIMFPSFSAYSSIMDNPSPRNIVNGAITQTFQILPSKYVEQGGNVLCDAPFKVKYCEALKQMATPEQLIEADLVCCIDQLSRSQRNKLEEHLQQGNYEEEIGVLEQPASGFSMTSLFILIVIVVVLGGGAAGYFVFAKKKKGKAEGTAEKEQPGNTPPAGVQAAGLAGEDQQGGTAAAQPGTQAGQQFMQGQATQETGIDEQFVKLKQYAYETLQQGYAPQDLLDHFVEQGWDKEEATEAINKAIERINAES